MNSNWSYSPETKIWVVTSVTLTFDLWPWPFAWTLPWSNVITPENSMMIRWWEHSQKGVTDGQTDRQTDRRTENTIHRAAWSQLKIVHWEIGTGPTDCPVSAVESSATKGQSHRLKLPIPHSGWGSYSRGAEWGLIRQSAHCSQQPLMSPLINYN